MFSRDIARISRCINGTCSSANDGHISGVIIEVISRPKDGIISRVNGHALVELFALFLVVFQYLLWNIFNA